jgi:predicted RNA binding protein YcfA (HicA-like mRNA interferase family)
MKPMKYKNLERILYQEGFVHCRFSKHIIFEKGSWKIAVPHTREVSPGTLRDIFKIVEQSKKVA